MILAMLAGLVLIAAVLIQPGKGDMISGLGASGMGGQFGSMIGMRRAADILVKTTIGVAVFIMVVALLINKGFLPVAENNAAKAATQNAEIPPISAPPAPPTQQAAPVQQQQAAPAQQQAAPAQQQAAPQSTKP